MQLSREQNEYIVIPHRWNFKSGTMQSGNGNDKSVL